VQKNWFNEKSCENYLSMCESEAGCNVETNQQANDTHRKHSVQKDWFNKECCEDYFSMCESEAGCNVETGQQDGCRAEEVKGITPLG
jgi:hypothetical protein